jgi:hypothetical protein
MEKSIPKIITASSGLDPGRLTYIRIQVFQSTFQVFIEIKPELFHVFEMIPQLKLFPLNPFMFLFHHLEFLFGLLFFVDDILLFADEIGFL